MAGLPGTTSLDLPNVSHLYQGEKCSPQDLIEEIISLADVYPDPAVWIHRLPRVELLAEAKVVAKRRQAGASLPLYGVPFAVKDNIDVAGLPTTAGCPAYSYVPERSAPVVARLQEAGAILVGKTNLDQFASGLAGDRSPYGACNNAFKRDYISGGSSSGSAVAVAAGLVSFALGTDTAGSGRVPAACNNIVGFKPARGLLSTEGFVPSCPSLDCVTVLALTVADAWTVYEAATERSPIIDAPNLHSGGGKNSFLFATPQSEHLAFFGDKDQPQLFRQALARLEEMGGHAVSIDFEPFVETAAMLYEGPWLAERLSVVERFLEAHAADMHSVTRAILAGGAKYSAVDTFNAIHRLEALRRTCMKVFDEAEMLVVPTVPTIPLLTEVQADSMGWSRRLGYYTNFANLLGLAALAIPSGFTSNGLPAGITLLAPAGSEQKLCEFGIEWQRRSNLPLGATGKYLAAPATVRNPKSSRSAPMGYVRLAVAGAHLCGQPLHADLRATGARYVRTCQTAPRYRFVALMDLHPPRPGLLKDYERAGTALVEIYDLPVAGFGKLVNSVAPPLAIGTVELQDGEMVKGFLCESWDAARARDVTDFGGWVKFQEHLDEASRPAVQPVSRGAWR